jgi:hypothetical protein
MLFADCFVHLAFTSLRAVWRRFSPRGYARPRTGLRRRLSLGVHQFTCLDPLLPFPHSIIQPVAGFIVTGIAERASDRS